jgi:hypothetical protein
MVRIAGDNAMAVKLENAKARFEEVQANEKKHDRSAAAL